MVDDIFCERIISAIETLEMGATYSYYSEQTNIERDKWLQLPPEMINHICSYLDVREVLILRLTTRKWRDAIKNIDSVKSVGVTNVKILDIFSNLKFINGHWNRYTLAMRHLQYNYIQVERIESTSIPECKDDSLFLCKYSSSWIIIHRGVAVTNTRNYTTYSFNGITLYDLSRSAREEITVFHDFRDGKATRKEFYSEVRDIYPDMKELHITMTKLSTKYRFPKKLEVLGIYANGGGKITNPIWPDASKVKRYAPSIAAKIENLIKPIDRSDKSHKFYREISNIIKWYSFTNPETRIYTDIPGDFGDKVIKGRKALTLES